MHTTSNIHTYYCTQMDYLVLSEVLRRVSAKRCQTLYRLQTLLPLLPTPLHATVVCVGYGTGCLSNWTL